MFIQRIRENEIPILAHYFICMKCSYYNRNEPLNEAETNLLNYLRGVSNFYVMPWHFDKDLRRAARKVAQDGMSETLTLIAENNHEEVRTTLKSHLIKYLRLAFGSDFIDLLENKMEVVVYSMKQDSYDDFMNDSTNALILDQQIRALIYAAKNADMIRAE